MTSTPALPAYIELRDDAAPMKFEGIDVVAATAEVGDPEVLRITEEEVVCGVKVAVLLFVEMVDVTDATTWEMVMVLVIVAVDVRVVVDSARARAGRSNSE